jgi:hypothetical protein
MQRPKGKPAGIIPPSVRFPDESVNGDEPDWTRTNMYWDYFEWEHNAGSMMLDQLYFTWTLTGDLQLLRPMLAGLDLIRTCASSDEPTAVGTPAWAARRLAREPAFWSTVEEWRSRSGETEYDDLIIRYGTPFSRARITGDDRHVESALHGFLDVMRVNRPLRTTEVLCTDRVRIGPGANVLKAMITGSGVHEGMSPYVGVSWENVGNGFTAYVRASDTSRLSVDLFNHSQSANTITARAWQLRPGGYRLSVTDGNVVLHEAAVRVDGRGSRLQLPLPSGRLLRLTIVPSS